MKKGVHTYIALALIVMIVISMTTAAFYWMTKIQGQMQAGTQRYNTELTGHIIKQVDVISFDYNSSSDNATIIMRNIGTKDLENLGLKDDKIVIISKDSSCDMWFNSSNCGACPFDLEVNKLRAIPLNFSATSCTGLDEGAQYSAHFALSEISTYTSFIAN